MRRGLRAAAGERRPRGLVVSGMVRLKRGAGAGWTIPSRSTKVPRAPRCADAPRRRAGAAPARSRRRCLRAACSTRRASCCGRPPRAVAAVPASRPGRSAQEGSPGRARAARAVPRRTWPRSARPTRARRRGSRRRRRTAGCRRAGWCRARRSSGPRPGEKKNAISEAAPSTIAASTTCRVPSPAPRTARRDAEREVERAAAEVADQVQRRHRRASVLADRRAARRSSAM